jgi:hypothetical protein
MSRSRIVTVMFICISVRGITNLHPVSAYANAWFSEG